MEPVKIFFCCTNVPEDKDLRDKLYKHLMSLKRIKEITMCLIREIPPGANQNLQHDERLQTADLVLPLISPDFIASDYHQNIEMQNVLTRQAAGDVIVIPILLRRTLIQGQPLEKFQILPRDGKSLKEQPDHDVACFEIAREISEVVRDHLRRKYTFLSTADTQILPNGSQIVDLICATCGEKNDPGRSICCNCGDLLYTDAAFAFSPPPAPIVGAGNAVICPKCGRSNRPGAKFCYKDGQPLSVSSPAHPIIQQAGPVPPVSLQIGPVPQATPQAGLSSQVFSQTGVSSLVKIVSPDASYTKLQLNIDELYGNAERSFIANRTVSQWSNKGWMRPGKGTFQYRAGACKLRRDSPGISMMYVSAYPHFDQPILFKNFAFHVEMHFGPSYMPMRGGIVFRAINDAIGQKYYYLSLCTNNTCSLDFVDRDESINIVGGATSVDFRQPLLLRGVIEDNEIRLSINFRQFPTVIDGKCSRGSMGIAIGDLINNYHSEIRFSKFLVWER